MELAPESWDEAMKRRRVDGGEIAPFPNHLFSRLPKGLRFAGGRNREDIFPRDGRAIARVADELVDFTLEKRRVRTQSFKKKRKGILRHPLSGIFGPIGELLRKTLFFIPRLLLQKIEDNPFLFDELRQSHFRSCAEEDIACRLTQIIAERLNLFFGQFLHFIENDDRFAEQRHALHRIEAMAGTSQSDPLKRVAGAGR